MSEQANPNQRLQEIESLIAQLINSQKHLLQAQVILSDSQDRTERLLEKLADHLLKQASHIDKIDERLASLSEKVDSLAASQAHSDARLDALIAVVDDPVRKNGKPGTSALQ